jgi:peptide/nickel transport system permease protein
VQAAYLLKRFGLLLAVLWTAATLNFFLPRLTPRNPVRERIVQLSISGGNLERGIEEMVKAYEAKFGLDQPLWKQYLRYLGDMARLDLGYSLTAFPKTVMELIAEVVGWSVGIASVTLLLSFSIGSLLGALIGWPKSPKFLQWIVAPLMTISSVPAYIFGLVLIYLLAFRAKIFPMMGGFTLGTIPDGSFAYYMDVLKHAILPCLSVILVSLGGWALGMRGMMVTVEGEDYMILAEAKGLKPRRIFLRYAVRNALLPLITGLGLSLGYLVTGQILVESLFGFPGIGSLLNRSINVYDYTAVLGITFMIILSVAVATLVLDLIYPLLDPRIRVGEGK